MDERDRRQIEVGAGLQESRLNTELIEWLQKWGPRVLYMLLAVVLGYLGWSKWQTYRQNQLDKAFDEYHAEQASQNPDVLLDIAQKNDGKGSIWSLATLDASDLLLTAGRLGVRPGVGPNAATDADALTEEERQNTLHSAFEHYKAVLNRNVKDPHHVLFAQKARWGMVSALISLGELDQARKVLEEYVSVAEQHAFTENAALGKKRLETLKNLTEPIPVYTSAQLPEANRPLVQNFGAGTSSTGPASGIQPPAQPGVTTESGKTIPLRKLTPEEALKKLKGENAPQGQNPPDTGKEKPEPGSDTTNKKSETPAETPKPADKPDEPSSDPGADPE